MLRSSPLATRMTPGIALIDLGRTPTCVPAGPPPAGSLAQLAGAGAWLVATPKRRVFPGTSEQVAVARHFVARVLDGCPAADDAVLCVSELASNAIRHTRTGCRGKFQVIIWRGLSSVCVAVLDEGSDSAPALAVCAPSGLAESGHGLLTVESLAAWWGHRPYRDGAIQGTAVWFCLDWNPVQPTARLARAISEMPIAAYPAL
jgi:serine/threonine-protein kinase RsbW